MQFPVTTIEYLRDEAYAFLCREAVQEKLTELECAKAEIESTRPPFGLLARKETRDAFTQSMRTVCDTEEALRDRLAQVEQLEEWLRPVIREEVISFLSAVSPDYQRYAEIRELLHSWERVFASIPELLLAFARDLRRLREEIAAGRRDMQTLAVVRDVVLRLDAPLASLANHSLELARLVCTDDDLIREIRLPALPEFRREAWVNRLALMPADQLIAQTTAVEAEARAYLNGGYALALSRIEASRTACGMFEERFCQHYWEQLRAHARAHYVEERDIDDVLAMLAQRYVNAHIESAQRQLTNDPFLTER